MNYNSLMNKPTINYRELIGDNTVTEVGGITEEQFNTLLNTDLSSYYTKAQIDDLFSRSYVYREKSGNIVTFDCPASVNGINKVVSEIVADQSGTGDPSPTNVRPISGWSAVNVVVSHTTDVEDGTTYTAQLKDGQDNPMTCYGGTLTNENGVQRLTVNMGMVDLGTLNWTYRTDTERPIFQATLQEIATSYESGTTPNILCSHYTPTDSSTVSKTSGDKHISLSLDGKRVYVQDSSYTNKTDFKQAVNGVQLLYELATPQTIPQDNLAIATQSGVNNLWCDSGDITVKALDKIIQG